MRAAILAGGRGTRLHPYTTVLPKPLLPVGERPILELIMTQLAADGFKRIDLCVGHLGELINVYMAEGASLPRELELDYHWEQEPLGTAGALRELSPVEDAVLVMNGDILTTLDYAELMRVHNEQGAALTIATRHKEVKLELGVLERDETEVTGYIEKPTLRYDVSMGVYVYSAAAIEGLPEGRLDFPDYVLKLIEAGERVCSFVFGGPWFDIGTPEEHARATAAYSDNPGQFERNG